MLKEWAGLPGPDQQWISILNNPVSPTQLANRGSLVLFHQQQPNTDSLFVCLLEEDWPLSLTLNSVIFLLLPPKSWDYRHELPWLGQSNLISDVYFTFSNIYAAWPSNGWRLDEVTGLVLSLSGLVSRLLYVCCSRLTLSKQSSPLQAPWDMDHHLPLLTVALCLPGGVSLLFGVGRVFSDTFSVSNFFPQP